ncbi:MAG: DUF1622 domain-containing protein [Streptococcaceae bacterium]|jgi:uncharacterized membrane protein|nr:DUF1622 domain-containing protein [Streptococcaceae bacterium]
MEYFAPFINIIVLILNAVSILILIFGVVKAIFSFVKNEAMHENKNGLRINEIKNYLGSYILLSLEILIAADIIESIMNPTVQDILILAAVVLIRTVISYFLEKEIKEVV